MKSFLEIAIPVLNEEEHLEKQIIKINNFLNDNFPKLLISIVIADNGSCDKTLEIAKILSSKENIRYVTTDKKGVGRALKKAWFSSDAEFVGYMDLDLATDINCLKKIIREFSLEKYPIINGSRYLYSSKIINRKFHRAFISRIFNIILKILFSTKITDGMIGFKFFKRDIVKTLFNNGAISDGWIFCTELLLVGEKLQIKIKEIPVIWEDDQSSKVKIINLTAEYLKALLILKIKFIR